LQEEMLDPGDHKTLGNTLGLVCLVSDVQRRIRTVQPSGTRMC
jgi:hypothetical protein